MAAPTETAAPATAPTDPQVKTTPRGSAVCFEIPVEKKSEAESAVRQRLEGQPPSPRKSKDQLDREHQEAEARHLAAIEEVKAKAANEVERAEKKKEEHEAREQATAGVPEPVITKATERAVAFEVETGKRPGSASPTKHRLEGAPPSPRKTKEEIDRDMAEAEKRRQAELAAVKAKAADEVERAQAVAAEAPKSPKKPAAPAPAPMAAGQQTAETPIVPKEPKPLDQLIAEDEAKRKKEPQAAEKKPKPAAAAKPKVPATKTAVKPAAKSPAKSPAKTPTKAAKPAASPAKASPAAKKTPTKPAAAAAATKPAEKKASPAKPAAAPAAAAKKTPTKK